MFRCKATSVFKPRHKDQLFYGKVEKNASVCMKGEITPKTKDIDHVRSPYGSREKASMHVGRVHGRELDA